ncbi:hypothetical protein KJ682_09565 [bacterium]|nr:hypothetical protein [bacterium]
MVRRLTALAVLSTLAAAALGAAGARAQGAAPDAGFIYATVAWPDGEEKTGFLRWEDEEAAWDDLFHSGQRELPWLEHADQDQLRAERRNRYYRDNGLFGRIMFALNEDRKDPVTWRIFLVRMGDIRSIEIHKGKDDFVVTADGSRHEVGGYANDAGSDLLLYTGDGEPESIEWNDLASITFEQAPPGLVPYAGRLYGDLEWTGGVFTGFIQWDKTECLTIDVLDGEDPDGRDHEVPMGDIAAIARIDGSSCRVDLRNGESLVLSGSNDVNRENRGIVVEVPGTGRVSVPWHRFVRLTFSEAAGSGPGRGDRRAADPIRGAIRLADGESLEGRLVLDLDKAWGWNFFSGTCEGLDYDIPLPVIRSLEPRDDSCVVTLASGLVLELSDSTESGQENAGSLVFAPGGGAPRYVSWGDTRRVDLQWDQ